MGGFLRHALRITKSHCGVMVGGFGQLPRVGACEGCFHPGELSPPVDQWEPGQPMSVVCRICSYLRKGAYVQGSTVESSPKLGAETFISGTAWPYCRQYCPRPIAKSLNAEDLRSLVILSNIIPWDVTLSRPVELHWYFGGDWCLHLQGLRVKQARIKQEWGDRLLASFFRWAQ
jgi:hypothetical protein